MDLDVATVPALRAVPGLVHGFERRSRPPGAESRDETRARVTRALAPRGRLYLLKQVHGATVVDTPFEGTPEADASVATRPGLLLGIETADCLPILLVDPGRRAAAAAHAGWRGTAAGVARSAVRALVGRGSTPADLLAAVGPGIGPCCYEVGEELKTAFGARGEAFFLPGPDGRPHLDLRAANVLALREEGVPSEAIVHVDECTRCLPARYHSYRRDGRGGGRMISFVGFESS
jgi:YfiH family protein